MISCSTDMNASTFSIRVLSGLDDGNAGRTIDILITVTKWLPSRQVYRVSEYIITLIGKFDGPDLSHQAIRCL